MLDPRFDPSEAEARLYEAWEAAGCFRPSMDTAAEPYCIVIPPPNVTGVLHMGHALNHTLQDVLIRFERMRGKNVLWQPGTDHAGIATQMVVERELANNGKKRTDMSREDFVAKVWEWKEKSGGQILEQDKRLGVSCDWSRTRFTMDEGLSAAVRKVFVQLYNEGLIYRDKRLVNWDPHFQTAISDLEVENREADGHMWHFKYPLADGVTYTYVEKDADGNVTLEETRDYISIATTRPETMLGDGAVAVHPDDARYAPIVGKLCEIPVGPKEHRRRIPIITDEYPDPAFGSGAVKITGAHDFNDYQVAKRGGIPMYALMDEGGAMRADGPPYAEVAAVAQRIAEGGEDWDAAKIQAMNLVPDEYRGLDRFEARARVVADITAEGLAVTVPGEDGEMVPYVENKTIMQPFGDRSGVVIEPRLTDQWFVDAGTLSKEARAAVEDGRTDFVPENWSKTYFNWLDNIEPWCISRQLWWGHRIPAWYGYEVDELGRVPADHKGILIPFVGSSEEEVLAAATEYYGDKVRIDGLVDDTDQIAPGYTRDAGGTLTAIELVRDLDVLDTWFSSALWPFSTLGWPDETEELKTFYPGAVLVTAFDIIFFWVARMMMMGLKFGPAGADGTPQVPFRDVYIHALVLDEKGQKMSKSKGNAMGLIELIDEYGADALRFTLAAMAAQGRNIRLSKQRVEGYRNFSTKLWNAARFCQMNECANWEPDLDPVSLNAAVNRWIVHETARTFAEATRALEEYRFDGAAGAAYRFVWNIFCDWYLELIKPVLNGEDETAKAETRRVAGWVLDQILKLLHPFMPFVTEELWDKLSEHGPERERFLMLEAWPDFGEDFAAQNAAEEIDWVIALVTEIRSMRADLGVPPAARVPAGLVNAGKASEKRLKRHGEVIASMARLDGIRMERDLPGDAVAGVIGEATLALSIADHIDIAEAHKRLEKEIGSLEKDIAGLEKKLGNANFIARAPAEVVEENRERLTDGKRRLEKLQAALKGLENLA
ncbi:MAG: valine--tRNA ligase [Alphaproteobacteria bacterium]|nr:valine--tRNA ligase [Alphaproteobacteria bacterium]